MLNQEEAVVISIRSAMKELQESVEDLCKAILSKTVKLGQLLSCFVTSCLVSSLGVKTFLLFVVNHDPAAPTPNGLAAGTAPAEKTGLDNAKNEGLEFHPD